MHAGRTTCATCNSGTSAPANPAEITSAGENSSIALDVAKVAALAPMPPHTSATRSLVHAPKPVVIRVFGFHENAESCNSGATSCFIAAMITMLGIAVTAEPPHGPTQRAFNRNDVEPEFALGLGRAHEHLLPPHTNCIYGSAWLPSTDISGYDSIADGRHHGDRVRDTHAGRRDTGDRCQLVEYL